MPSLAGQEEGDVMGSDTKSVRSILAGRKVYIHLRPSDPDDLSTEWFIRTITDNPDLFESLYSRHPLLGVFDLDTLYYYLLTRKIARMSDLTQYLDHDDDDLLKKLTDDAVIAMGKITDSAVLYVNEHPEAIFSESQTDYELKSSALDFIIECQEDICYQVFEYLCRNLHSLIVFHYEELRNVFAEHPELFSVLFPPERPVMMYGPELQKVLDVWRQRYRENSGFIRLIDQRVEKLCVQAEIFFKSPSNDFLETAPVIRAVSLFLEQIHNARAAEFSAYTIDAEKKLRAYLHLAKSSYKFKIPERDIHLNQWKVINPRNVSLADLTHRLISEGESKYESFLGLSPQNRPTGSGSAAFPDRIPFLSELEKVNAGNFLTVLVNQDIFYDYIKKVKDAVHFISGQASRSGELLEEDASMLVFLLESVSQNINARKPQKRPAICYAASVFCCALTEKLLRPFYLPVLKSIQLKKRKKFDRPLHPKQFQIGCIQDENFPMIGSLTLEHRLGLVYFLSRISDRNTQGYCKEYRNRLAHWTSDMNPRLMTPDWFARLLWLFTDALNSVYLYYKHQTGSSWNGS